MTATTTRNDDLLHLARLTGARVRTYEGWQNVGRQVRRGEKQRRYFVEENGRVFACWGFEEGQLYTEGGR